VAVAVDGATAIGKDGKPGAYTPRSAEEMQRIEQLVRSAVGFDQERGDQISVVNVRFERPADQAEGVLAASPFTFDKNDIMRGGELVVMLAVAVLLVLFVVAPMLKGPTGPSHLALAMAGGAPGAGGGQPVLAVDPETGQTIALPAPVGEIEQRIDIARIEGQVKASSVKKVAEFVDNHPEESVSILRTWLHES
jgi:flagellar M-ring protein FliF